MLGNVIDKSESFRCRYMGNMLRREKARLVVNPAHKNMVSRDLIEQGKVFFTEAAAENELYVVDMALIEQGLPLQKCIMGA